MAERTFGQIEILDVLITAVSYPSFFKSQIKVTEICRYRIMEVYFSMVDS